MDKGIAISGRTIYMPPTDTWAWLEVICTKPATYLDVWGETCKNRFERTISHPFHILRKDGTVLSTEPGDRIADYDECSFTFGTTVKILRLHLLAGILSEEELEQVDESAIDILASGRECISVPISLSDLPRDMKASVKRSDTLGVFCDMPGMRDEQFEFLILSRWPVREDILAANGIEVTDGVATATAAER